MADLIDREKTKAAFEPWLNVKGYSEGELNIIRAVLYEITIMPSAQPDIIHCKDCKHWMPYDWMFSEVWRSVSMDDYSDNEIGCAYCDMNMHANDFCSRAGRKNDE